MAPPNTRETALPAALERARVTRTALPLDSAEPVRTVPFRELAFQLRIWMAAASRVTGLPSTLLRAATSAAALRAAAGPPVGSAAAAARAAASATVWRSFLTA